jgi:hypothetical protein
MFSYFHRHADVKESLWGSNYLQALYAQKKKLRASTIIMQQ